MLIVIFRRVSPATLSRKYAALIVCLTLLAAGGGSFITLGKVFAAVERMYPSDGLALARGGNDGTRLLLFSAGLLGIGKR
jgi:hypothetical protein